jgi:DNA-binding CsgD family transcriptional regulator
MEKLKPGGWEMESLQTLDMMPAYNDLPCYIFWKDKELRYQGGNDKFLQALGLKTNDQIIGKTDYNFPWAQDAERYQQSDLLVLTGKSILSKETRWCANGEIDVIVNKVPIKNAQQKIIGILGMHKDVEEYLDLHSSPPDFLIQQNESALLSTVKDLVNDSLSHREIECVSLWLSGHSIKASADCLGLSHKSIEAYRKQIKDKMGVYHRHQLIEAMQTKKAFHVLLTLAKVIQQKPK